MLNLAAMSSVADSSAVPYGDFPERLDREYEARLVRLAAARPRDPEAWRMAGPGFFMAGLAVMLASVRGEDRSGLLVLAEALSPGASTPEAFARWLQCSPVRPSRFLPMLEMESRRAA